MSKELCGDVRCAIFDQLCRGSRGGRKQPNKAKTLKKRDEERKLQREKVGRSVGGEPKQTDLQKKKKKSWPWRERNSAATQTWRADGRCMCCSDRRSREERNHTSQPKKKKMAERVILDFFFIVVFCVVCCCVRGGQEGHRRLLERRHVSHSN